MLGDLPENAAVTLTFNSVNCHHPCHKCLVEREKLNNVELTNDQIILKTPENMRCLVEQNSAQQYSLHDMKNIFWNYPQLNIYLSTIPDRMHHLDLGLFNYQVTYTRVLLKELCGQIAVDELDNRLAKIPRFPGLKIFKNGLENIKRFTANEFRNMMKNLIKQWAKSFIKLFKEYSLSELQLPKLHNWCYHIIKTIREYGAINGFTMETYEFLHKEAVKIPYRSSNKRDLTDQMIKSVYRKEIIKYLLQRTNVNRRKQKTLMNSLLGTFNLQDFDAFFNNYRSNNSLAREALTALEYFLESLNEFLDLCEGLTDNETINISCDVSISMSEEESEDYNTAEGGACFGKVLMLINVKIIEKDLSFDLALVQWYDFCNSRQLYKYDCPWLKIINTYNFVPIESIIELVQVVQRAERQNEYFVNTFMF
ncbi:uncharacterized protein OCT59_004071 [Rhizophagus irregularis]|uniref:uncharacterized protein n=1 Tax=Rhizophagus irregularis TaxID=588596 RepID=UPI003328BFD6|nr:hypothetical protein OCT59_004071 [Rhizophagus irregularis]